MVMCMYCNTFQKKVNYFTPTLSIVLHSISECTLTTHCEVCIVGYKRSNYNKILNTKVVFSFGEHIIQINVDL